MNTPLLFALPGNEKMAARLASNAGMEPGQVEYRSFPDGEAYLRFAIDPKSRDIAILCTLDRPDTKVLSLLFAAATVRELGATRIGLVAPYLAYMRQDRRFLPGEAVTSRYLARLLSQAFDWLVTVDPHLHRYGSLAEIYTIPTSVVHAAPLISEWIKSHVTDAIVIGPDSESEQWVSSVARQAGVPFTVLWKTRRGDRDVEIKVRNLEDFAERTPVFVDDIVSSGQTMLQAIKHVRRMGTKNPICVAVHGIFADGVDALLAAEGARLVTSNTIEHPSNAMDVGPLLAKGIRGLMAQR